MFEGFPSNFNSHECAQLCEPVDWWFALFQFVEGPLLGTLSFLVCELYHFALKYLKGSCVPL